MKPKLLFRELRRKLMQVLLYALTMLLLTAFFCASFNLYCNSVKNLRLANETYSTIAVPELHAEVDRNGRLLSAVDDPQDYAGYQAVTAWGYDLAPILNAPGITGHDLRTRYGAYAPNATAVRSTGGSSNIPWGPIYIYDVIRFKVIADVTEYRDNPPPPSDDGFIRVQTLGVNQSASGGPTVLKMEILESASGIFSYEDNLYILFQLSQEEAERYSEEIARLNGEESAEIIVFEPGTEYIGFISAQPPLGDERFPITPNGLYRTSNIYFNADNFFVERSYAYSTISGEYVSIESGDHPFWMYRYEDVQNDPALAERIAQIGRAYHINAHSFGVMATDDLSSVPVFHVGGLYVAEGRPITAEEYAHGSRVCLISADLAALQHLQVGDSIDYSFYEYDYFSGDTLKPSYTDTQPDSFFDSGAYTIVGIYDMRPAAPGDSAFKNAHSVPWNTIFVPKSSIRNAPADADQPIASGLLSIRLENGAIESFLEAMDARGVTGSHDGAYEISFTFYDQGFSRIQPSLNALSGTSELLLILSSLLLLIAALALAFFFTLGYKQSMGIMRLMGAAKGKVLGTVLLAALLTILAGTAIGTALGYGLTEQIGQRILTQSNVEPEAFHAFSAYIATAQTEAPQLALGAEFRISAFCFAAALALFLTAVLAFSVRYLRRPPRALLPQGHE